MPPKDSIAVRLQGKMDSLTRAERQLAHKILENYPVSGLGSITTVSENAGVSTPTAARMVQKLGYGGYAEFQAALRQEIEARVSSPLVKHESWAGNVPDEHILNRFADAAIENIRRSLAQLDVATFDAVCQLLASEKSPVFVVGGRITRALADYFFLHLQVVRPRVTLIQSISNAWPHYILEVDEGDVVVIFDVRRYENSTLKLAEMVAERGARIVLFTDQWRSPVHKFADYSFNLHIDVPSSWDSAVVIMLLLETVIAKLQELTWDKTRPRMEALEDMFDRTRFFRKFT